MIAAISGKIDNTPLYVIINAIKYNTININKNHILVNFLFLSFNIISQSLKIASILVTHPL